MDTPSKKRNRCIQRYNGAQIEEMILTYNHLRKPIAWVVELVDTLVLGTSASACGFESHLRYIKGELAEWSIALVLKTGERESVPGVRIPHSPHK